MVGFGRGWTTSSMKKPRRVYGAGALVDWLGPFLAETEGFEPSMRLYTPYSLSRGAPSETRSRFQWRDYALFHGSGRFLVQPEGLEQAAHGHLHVFFVDHDRGLYFGCGDHLDVDAFFAEHAKHLAGHAHMAAHADPDDADFADVGVANHFVRAQHGEHFFLDQIDGAGVVVAVHGEAEVGFAILAQVLDDHVDIDVGIGHGAQDQVGDAGLVGHAEHGELGFVAVESDAGYDGLFHFFVLLESDQRAGAGFFVNVHVPGGEARQHAQPDPVLAGEFDRADLQQLAAPAGHFKHFLQAHRREVAGLGHHARGGGGYPVDQ